MYNNEVTYHKKWYTDENKSYQDKVIKLLRGRTLCMSDCPQAWSKEVYEFLTYLDKEFGIAYNLPYPAFFNWKYFWKHFKTIPKSFFIQPDWIKKNYGFWKRQGYRFKESWRKTKWLTSRYYMTIKMIVVNKYRKPKIFISQVKEKYGELRVYFGCPEYLHEYIDDKIRETEIKLANKGAYYKLESLYNWGSTRWDKEHSVITRRGWYKGSDDKRTHYTEVTNYNYRKLMHKMEDIDFEEIKRKVNKKGKKNA